MSLFNDGTIIIIGAGASVPFGLPNGLQLMSLISDRLREGAKLCKLANNNPTNQNYDLTFPAIILNASDSKNRNYYYAEKALGELADFLEKQTSDTIDDVIRFFPEKATVLKTCIAYELFMATHFKNRNNGLFQLNAISRREYPPRENAIERLAQVRNWMHLLINVARNELKVLGNVTQAKAKIITFNYDDVLEHVLSEMWCGEDIGLPSWQDIFEIIHIHGKTELCKNIEIVAMNEHVINIANSIYAANENIENAAIENERTKCREWISKAHTLYCIGFAFARSNCDILGLTDG